MVNKVAINLFIFFASAYLLTASIVNICNTDAGQLRLEVVRSIVERFDVSVPEGTGIIGIDGREYSWVGIGSAIVAIPFYIIAKLSGSPPENAVSVINLLVGAATAVTVFLFSISLGYSKHSSVLVSNFYGLGTMAWPLAKQPFDHTVETFFVLNSAYFIHCYTGNRKIRYLILSSISLGFAFITRHTSLLSMPLLLVLITAPYLEKTDFKGTLKSFIREIVLFSIFFIPFVGLSFWYNYYRFGSAFETGYTLMATRLGLDFFTGTSLLTGLSGFILSPGKGLFYYSPIAILFFFSIRPFVRRHRAISTGFVVIIASYLLFMSKNIYWHGDWAWGPRYILVIMPFLIIPVAELVDSRTWQEKSFLKLLTYAIFAVSLTIQLIAISVDFQKYFINLKANEKVRFTVAHGKGVQPIVEPPAEFYFQWSRSPILAHYQFIYEMAGTANNDMHSEFKENVPIRGKIKEQINEHNVLDFWWMNAMYTGTPLYIILLELTFLGFIIVLSWFRILKMVE